MRTFNQKHDTNAKQLKKQHNEFRKLRKQKGWGSTKSTKDADNQHNSFDHEYQGCV